MRVTARLLNVLLSVLLFVSILVILSDFFGKNLLIVPKAVQDTTPPPPAGDFMSERISLKRNYVSNHPIARPPRRMIEFYKLQVPQRRAYLDAVIESMSKNYMYLYNNLAPEAYCPELVRVGTTNDGGKWICSPFRIPVSCNILSLGMYNEITFEQELQHITDQRCNLFAYDMNKQEPRTLALLKRIKVGVRVAEVSAETNELKKQYTIEDLMKFEGISNFEILKIDIEGSEFQVIPPLLRKHKPAQILIEIHGTPSETVWLLREIASQGYWLYSYEINGALHHLCEYSFIHESAFNQYGVTPIAKYLN